MKYEKLIDHTGIADPIQASAPETRTWQVVEDDKSKDYFVAEYANGHRQQIKRNTALWNAAWDIAKDRKFFVDEIAAIGKPRKSKKSI